MTQNTNQQNADAWEERAREELTKFEQEPEAAHEPAEPRCETWEQASEQALAALGTGGDV
jgi:hypothetical protein